MELISMVKFVLNKEKDFNNGNIGFREFTNQVCNYANFLKKPLEIGMFINPVAEISIDAYMQPKEVERQYLRYHEAKQKCIFNGFKLIPDTRSIEKNGYVIDLDYIENNTIESLLKHNIKL
jgi:hypothetical protein